MILLMESSSYAQGYEERRQNPDVGPLIFDPANIHELTRLPNRAAYNEATAYAIETFPGNFAVVLLDSDGLKAVNDEYGHAAGNRYIIETAQALEESVRETDLALVIHLSGDEFALILPGVSRQDDLKGIIARIQSQLDAKKKPTSMGGKVHTPGETATELFDTTDSLLKNNKLIRAYDNSTPEQRQFAVATVARALELGMSPRDIAKLAAAAALREAGLNIAK